MSACKRCVCLRCRTERLSASVALSYITLALKHITQHASPALQELVSMAIDQQKIVADSEVERHKEKPERYI